jgi:hypothetical protein
MDRVYKVPFSYTGNAAPASIDLLELNAAAGMPLYVLGFTIFQTSDFGDAAEEGTELIFSTAHSTSGSGGSASTPVTHQGAAAASFTAEQANTTIATGGTPVERGRWGWNVRMEKEKVFAEFERILVPGGGRGVFKYNTTPADSLTIRGELIVLEVG